MQQALDSNTLDRLIALGRQQGQLTTHDLETNLPIHAMSAEDIALIVVHLEESGIPVELEESLMASHPKPAAVQTRSAEIIPFPDRAAVSQMKKRAAPLQTASQAQAGSPSAQQGKRAAHWAVAVAGLLVLALMVGALVVFGV